ncbi:protein Mis18-alpha [Saccopteryx leptura]|uniref:protein Mis18-alpha n=1 Tax=Saccopteryx leptura TaxID=249018 RepID=UPI00339C46AC
MRSDHPVWLRPTASMRTSRLPPGPPPPGPAPNAAEPTWRPPARLARPTHAQRQALVSRSAPRPRDSKVMAGVWTDDSCRRCSSASCSCRDRDTVSSPSLLSQCLPRSSSRHQLLRGWTSTWSSLSGAVAEAPTQEEDRPLVFLCSRCRRPLGDSLSWVTGMDDSDCILLRCVSSNVSVDKEQILSKRENENGCILEALYCTGCSLSLGYIYKCTPNSLDYKRDLFCFKVEAIESYVLGSSEKQIVSEAQAFNLESRIEIENSLKQMEDVLKVLQTKLWEIETKLPITSSKS